MYPLFQAALIFHVACGALALLVFWVPVLSRKGSPLHRKAGRLFVFGMTAIAVSGVVLSSLSLLDPIGVKFADRQLPMDEAFRLAIRIRTFSLFLLMLSVLVFTSARHAVLVLKLREDRTRLRAWWHAGPMVLTVMLALATGVVGALSGEVLLMIFCVIGTAAGGGMLRYTFKKSIGKREWIIEHIGSTIGTGIAAYTAFFAFGGRELLGHLLTGQWQLVPWVLPAAIGTIFIRRLSKPYRAQLATVAATQ